MANLIGQSLGRYHILEQLGEGGMATVYKAYDTRLETDVAVKFIRTDALPQNAVERTLKRFEREAKSLAKLTHPNIVKVMDYGGHEGVPYLVLVYLPGGTLKKRMGQPMPWQEAVRFLIPIANALEYAHDHNVIHRDVKPANILLTEKGQPMLTDFGIAKILETEGGQTLTGTGMGVGTPEYMSPEQGMGREVDGRADIYSLGVVLYELITGRKPFTADTPMAVILKQMTDPLPRPRQLVANLPEAVERLLIKALAKDPADRYQNMEEFSAALEKLALRENKEPHASRAPKTQTAPSHEQTLDTQITYDQQKSEIGKNLDKPYFLNTKQKIRTRNMIIVSLALTLSCLLISSIVLNFGLRLIKNVNKSDLKKTASQTISPSLISSTFTPSYTNTFQLTSVFFPEMPNLTMTAPTIGSSTPSNTPITPLPTNRPPTNPPSTDTPVPPTNPPSTDPPSTSTPVPPTNPPSTSTPVPPTNPPSTDPPPTITPPANPP